MNLTKSERNVINREMKKLKKMKVCNHQWVYKEDVLVFDYTYALSKCKLCGMAKMVEPC